jgi:hypothetical protein
MGKLKKRYPFEKLL